MVDTRFRDPSRAAQNLDAFQVSADYPEFLQSREFTFVFFTSSLPRLRLLYGKHENYQQGTIQFSQLQVAVSSILGRACAHCSQPTSSPSDCCVVINNGAIVATVHESCFKAWFTSTDQARISPYRLVRAVRRKLTISGGSFKIQIDDGEKVDEYAFTALEPVRLEDLASQPPVDATMVQGGSFGFSGTPPQGFEADDYVACMPTMSGEESVNSAPQATSTYRTEVECPHCRGRLVVTLETKGS